MIFLLGMSTASSLHGNSVSGACFLIAALGVGYLSRRFR